MAFNTAVLPVRSLRNSTRITSVLTERAIEHRSGDHGDMALSREYDYDAFQGPNLEDDPYKFTTRPTSTAQLDRS